MKEYTFKSKKGWQCVKKQLEVGDYINNSKKHITCSIKEIKNKISICDVITYRPSGDNIIERNVEINIKETNYFDGNWFDKNNVMHSCLVFEEYLDI